MFRYAKKRIKSLSCSECHCELGERAYKELAVAGNRQQQLPRGGRGHHQQMGPYHQSQAGLYQILRPNQDLAGPGRPLPVPQLVPGRGGFPAGPAMASFMDERVQMAAFALRPLPPPSSSLSSPQHVFVNPLPPPASLGPLPPTPIVETGADDPLYDVLKPPPPAEEVKDGSSAVIPGEVTSGEGEEEDNNAGDKVAKEEKTEIEYWQITAKEVVKFRPCTETFIQRT